MNFDPQDLPEENQQEILAQAQIAGEAWRFLRCFYSGDLVHAWEVMHPVLRLCWAQWWSDANRQALQATGYDFEVAAEALSQSNNGEHPLWKDFSRVILRDFRKAYPLDVEVAAIGSAPRLMALDTELLYIHPDSPTGGLWQDGETRGVYPMVMRFEEPSWLVLNWASKAIPSPGYPPTLF